MEMDPVRLAMMQIAESLAPIHELVDGEVAHFLRQGFTIEQAHALAAVEVVNAFGMKIYGAATRPEDEQ
jgi:hypothetical protein